jgi:hypothetical protein
MRDTCPLSDGGLFAARCTPEASVNAKIIDLLPRTRYDDVHVLAIYRKTAE